LKISALRQKNTASGCENSIVNTQNDRSLLSGMKKNTNFSLHEKGNRGKPPGTPAKIHTVSGTAPEHRQKSIPFPEILLRRNRQKTIPAAEF
jgi:hypothetical protein